MSEPTNAASKPTLPPERRRALLSSLLRSLIHDDRLSAENVHDVLAVTLSRLALALHCEGLFVLLFDPEGETVECLASFISDSERSAGAPEIDNVTLAFSEAGFLGDPAWRQSPMLLEHVARDLPQPPALVRALGRAAETLALVPLRATVDVHGLLVAVNRVPAGGFAPSDLELLIDVGSFIAKAIRRSMEASGPLSDVQRSRYSALLAGCPFKVVDSVEVSDLQLLEQIGEETLRRYEILPLEHVRPGELRAAITDPLDWERLRDFEAVTGYRIVEKIVSPRSCIVVELDRAFPQQPANGAIPAEDELTKGLVDDLEALTARAVPGALTEDVDEGSAPIVRLASRLIEEAASWGASDIHIEAAEAEVIVRYRIDGICRERVRLPHPAANPLVARLKIMSELDVAEHRLPQDGRIAFDRFSPGIPIDLRVSVVPMLHGECVVMRLLDKRRSTLPLDQLGFSPPNLRAYMGAIRSPFGMILHCGPTGSGKSMTLYAALNEVNDKRWKIVTAEDPIEYTLPGINQLQVRPSIGLTFASALRSFLRHDPDIILVGEIRDPETAQIAVEASLTGHLLLSTLHTNDAASSVARLVRLGIEPSLVASTLVCVCAQRLLRRVCLECREGRAPTVTELALLMESQPGLEVEQLFSATGCERCRQSGYKGRTGIHELMLLSSRLRQRINDAASTEELTLFARRQGMRTLYQDALDKVRSGTTTLEEAQRVTTSDLE